jgi:hypothetical protein
MFSSPKYDCVVREVDNSFKILDLKNDLTAMAVALGLSSILSVPVTPVDVPRDYFNQNCAPVILTYVSEINERLIIDINLTRELAYSFWYDRYSALHRADYLKYLYNVGTAGSYLDFIRPSRTMFTPAQVVLLEENGRPVVAVALAVTGAIAADLDARAGNNPA